MDILIYLRHQWDRIAAWAAIGLGAVLLLLGWLGASGQVLPAGQIPYLISGGLGGLFAAGIGAVLWLSADLRDEWRQLHAIAEQLAAADDRGHPEPLPPAAPTGGDTRRGRSHERQRRSGAHAVR